MLQISVNATTKLGQAYRCHNYLDNEQFTVQLLVERNIIMKAWNILAYVIVTVASTSGYLPKMLLFSMVPWWGPS